MAFRNAQQAQIYVGLLNASCYARSVNANASTSMLDTTTICDKQPTFIPGHEESSFSIDGPLDVDASSNGQFDAITDLKGSSTATPITYLPLGTDGHAWLIDANQTNFTAMAGGDTTVDWSMEAQTTGQTDFNGVLLENATTVTIDTDGTANNNGAGTTNGAVFHLHVTAYSGLTSDDIIVEGSTTGSFSGEETTIATFAQVTGVGAERVVVTGTVPRYLRVADDVTGSGSITRTVAVSRR